MLEQKPQRRLSLELQRLCGQLQNNYESLSEWIKQYGQHILGPDQRLVVTTQRGGNKTSTDGALMAFLLAEVALIKYQDQRGLHYLLNASSHDQTLADTDTVIAYFKGQIESLAELSGRKKTILKQIIDTDLTHRDPHKRLIRNMHYVFPKCTLSDLSMQANLCRVDLSQITCQRVTLSSCTINSQTRPPMGFFILLHPKAAIGERLPSWIAKMHNHPILGFFQQRASFYHAIRLAAQGNGAFPEADFFPRLPHSPDANNTLMSACEKLTRLFREQKHLLDNIDADKRLDSAVGRNMQMMLAQIDLWENVNTVLFRVEAVVSWYALARYVDNEILGPLHDGLAMITDPWAIQTLLTPIMTLYAIMEHHLHGECMATALPHLASMPLLIASLLLAHTLWHHGAGRLLQTFLLQAGISGALHQLSTLVATTPSIQSWVIANPWSLYAIHTLKPIYHAILAVQSWQSAPMAAGLPDRTHSHVASRLSLIQTVTHTTHSLTEMLPLLAASDIALLQDTTNWLIDSINPFRFAPLRSPRPAIDSTQRLLVEQDALTITLEDGREFSARELTLGSYAVADTTTEAHLLPGAETIDQTYQTTIPEGLGIADERLRYTTLVPTTATALEKATEVYAAFSTATHSVSTLLYAPLSYALSLCRRPSRATPEP